MTKDNDCRLLFYRNMSEFMLVRPVIENLSHIHIFALDGSGSVDNYINDKKLSELLNERKFTMIHGVIHN